MTQAEVVRNLTAPTALHASGFSLSLVKVVSCISTRRASTDKPPRKQPRMVGLPVPGRAREAARIKLKVVVAKATRVTERKAREKERRKAKARVRATQEVAAMYVAKPDRSMTGFTEEVMYIVIRSRKMMVETQTMAQSLKMLLGLSVKVFRVSMRQLMWLDLFGLIDPDEKDIPVREQMRLDSGADSASFL